MKLSLTVMLLCICSSNNAQSSVIYKIIDSLQKKNIDTIVHYYRKCETLYGYLDEYLLWRQKSTTKIMKYTYSDVGLAKDTYFIRPINDDSIFSYLNKYLDKINGEHLEPIICKIQTNSVIYYSTMEHLHPCIIHFAIIQKKKQIDLYQDYKPEDLDERFLDMPEYENLNYPFNSSTHLFKFIKMIQKEIK